MNKLNKRKPQPKQATKERTWWPKQISRAEYERRHAEHIERMSRMGIAKIDMAEPLDGRGELRRGA